MKIVKVSLVFLANYNPRVDENEFHSEKYIYRMLILFWLSTAPHFLTSSHQQHIMRINFFTVFDRIPRNRLLCSSGICRKETLCYGLFKLIQKINARQYSD